MQNYGESLKYQREISGLNQPELAKKIGTSQTNVSRWERGIVLPSIDFCVRLAKYYGITLDELVGISEEPATSTAAPMGEAMPVEKAKNEHERELLQSFRELSPYLQGVALDTIRGWAGKPSGGSLHKKA